MVIYINDYKMTLQIFLGNAAMILTWQIRELSLLVKFKPSRITLIKRLNILTEE